MTEIKALADITSEQTSGASGDLLFIERGGLAAKITYSALMDGSYTQSGTVTVTGTYDMSGGTLTLSDNQIGGEKVAAATDSTRGTVEKSTSTENTAGTAVDVFPDVAGVREILEAFKYDIIGLVPLASIDLSDNATADFTAFDETKFDSYEFVLSNVIPATDSVRLQMRLSNDGGATFLDGAADYEFVINRTLGELALNGDHFDLTNNNDCGNDADKGISGTVKIYGPHLARYTSGEFQISSTSDNDGGLLLKRGVLRYIGAAEAHNAAQFRFSVGNLSSGTITMYGKRGAS